MRGIPRPSAAPLLALAVVALMTGCGAHTDTAAGGGEAVETPFADWASLRRPTSPNTALVAPPGSGIPGADAEAPVFAASPAAVAEAWRAVVAAEPRTAILRVSADGLRVEAEQRTAVLGFVDRISAEVMPLAPEQTSIAVYSRSTTGYWDFGVNRSRVEAWLRALRDRLGTP